MIPVQTIELPLTGRENDGPSSVAARLSAVGGKRNLRTDPDAPSIISEENQDVSKRGPGMFQAWEGGYPCTHSAMLA